MKRILEYKDIQHTIDKLLQDKESGEVEFKSAAGGFPGTFWSTYSSFANTNGGAIILGVKEKDERFYLDGLNERLRYALDIHRADISDMLSKMCEDKLLMSTGYGRGTKYHIYNANVALTDSNVALTDPNVALTDPNVALTDPNVALTDSNVALKRKRYSKSEMESMVLSVCQDWKTAEEIASSVGRNVVYIKNTVLPSLTNVIEKMYDIPHHPKQKYRAKQIFN